MGEMKKSRRTQRIALRRTPAGQGGSRHAGPRCCGNQTPLVVTELMVWMWDRTWRSQAMQIANTAEVVEHMFS